MCVPVKKGPLSKYLMVLFRMKLYIFKCTETTVHIICNLNEGMVSLVE